MRRCRQRQARLAATTTFPGKWPRFYTAMSPLVVDGMAILHSAAAAGAFVAYDLADGTQKWKWAGDGATYASPVLMTVDGIKLIVAQTDKRMIALARPMGNSSGKSPLRPRAWPITPSRRSPTGKR